VTSANVTERAG